MQISGVYICECLNTFIKDPVSQACYCADGFEAVEGECTDVDECAGKSPCSENEVSTLRKHKHALIQLNALVNAWAK